MAKRGPQRKPKQLLEAKGARVRKDRYPDEGETMKISPGGKSAKLSQPTKPPTYLTPGAKRIWKEVSLFLHQNDMSHVIFNGSLEVYCKYLDVFREKSKYLKTVGDTYALDTKEGEKWLPRPEVKIMDDAAKQVRAVASHYGLTPSSISQINVKQPKDEASPWSKIG